MRLNFRDVFLKSLPYLLSITGGIILYTGAIDNSPNDNIRDLVINVSASLLSIPLVFFTVRLYELSCQSPNEAQPGQQYVGQIKCIDVKYYCLDA